MKNKNTNVLEKKSKPDIDSENIDAKNESNPNVESTPILSISEKLKKKIGIIKSLRNLLKSNDNDSSIHNSVKKLQEEWKNVGFIDSKKEKSLWSSYKALLDIFYIS